MWVRLDILQISMPSKHMQKNQKAFTLIELMVALAILAVALGLALPNFKNAVANNRSVGTGGELVTALNFARTEAIKRGKRVTLCTTTDGASCLATSDWTKGWLVFTDQVTTDSGTPSLGTTPADNVLRYWKDLPDNMVATAVTKPSNTAIHFIRFTGLGSLARAGNDSESRELNISIVQCKGTQKSKIKVGIAGIVTSTKVNCP
jgi:type IV fimbrial biogenesis protein FimT